MAFINEFCRNMVQSQHVTSSIERVLKKAMEQQDYIITELAVVER